MATIYHGTPMTPIDAAQTVMPGRAVCISFYRPDSAAHLEPLCPQVMYDNGAFSFWKQAQKAGNAFDETSRDWTPFYRWLEERLHHEGRWAVIPDVPGAPSQLNDALLKEWPFGTEKGAPLYHMDAPLSRLGRLCETYSRVCLGWIGDHTDPATLPVGSPAYVERMDEIARFLGNQWPTLHMMRGVAVARDYPFRVRRQHQPRAKRLALRLHGRSTGSVQRRREMDRPSLLRRPTGAASHG